MDDREGRWQEVQNHGENQIFRTKWEEIDKN